MSPTEMGGVVWFKLIYQSRNWSWLQRFLYLQ